MSTLYLFSYGLYMDSDPPPAFIGLNNGQRYKKIVKWRRKWFKQKQGQNTKVLE